MSYCHESAADEPLAGTAPFRKVWLMIEQPGAWGEDALLESQLPAGFGAELKALVTDPEIGIALARRPELTSQERRSTRRRRLWLAHTSAFGVRMRAGSLDDIRDVLRWDWAAIKRGELPSVGRRSADPAIFICTNGKKDLSCALLGRRIIDDLREDQELTGQIFESSHLTGHRFAPTALLLPWGYMYGRLDTDTTRAALTRAWEGQTLTEHLRGRTAFAPWAQVAELSVRTTANQHGLDSLDVLVWRGERALPWQVVGQLEKTDVVEVRHQAGKAWRVQLEQVPVSERLLSCDAKPESGMRWQTTSVTEAENWVR